MVSRSELCKWSLDLEEVEARPYFEKVAFYARDKIFATLNKSGSRACVKLREDDQALFASYNQKVIWVVPNKWGKLGWTFVDLHKVGKTLMKAVLKASYCAVAPKKLAAKYRAMVE